MTDASSGIMPTDYSISKVLRKYDKKILHIANKSDKDNKNFSLKDVFKIGFGEALLISAEHNLGFNNLYYELNNFFDKHKITSNFDEKFPIPFLDKNKRLKVSFIGKPNTGKSTLINKILGQNRLVTGNTPGLTKDSIETVLNKNNIDFLLTDTAGIRKKSNIIDSIEKISVNKSFGEIRKSDVCILIIDSTEKIQKTRFFDCKSSFGEWKRFNNRTKYVGFNF
jgi:small GTP-binding protein domain